MPSAVSSAIDGSRGAVTGQQQQAYKGAMACATEMVSKEGEKNSALMMTTRQLHSMFSVCCCWSRESQHDLSSMHAHFYESSDEIPTLFAVDE